jgi:hypothetical protein
MTKYFLTFGGPTHDYHKAAERICKEARTFQVFDEIIGRTDSYLKADTVFWKTHGHFIETNARGYGYWLWKSYLVKKQLETMKADDILLYADAGCVLNVRGKQKLLEYFDMVKMSEYGILSFQMPHIEHCYTKMDLIHYLNGFEHMDTGQLVGGIFVLRKCPHTIALVNKWYEVCCNYDLLNDNPSKIPNHPKFKEARHDQSIWSLLRKEYGTLLLLECETWFEKWTTDGVKYPIWAMRKRHG